MTEETDVTWPTRVAPVKKKRHSWIPLSNGTDPNLKQCFNCKLVKYFDYVRQITVYQDQWGHTYYKLPACK